MARILSRAEFLHALAPWGSAAVDSTVPKRAMPAGLRRPMTQNTRAIAFGPYRLDVAGGRLSKGPETVAIQPRPLAVLSYLAARPGIVVSRDEIITRLWDGAHVTKAVLKVAVRAIREALEDDAEAPRYVETVGREGYRFIGRGGAGVPGAAPAGASDPQGAMVGRETELATLHAALARATGGARTILFVSGEAGVGKTTLLDRFLGEVDGAQIRVARGQCLEQYGEGEAYLPILEAVGRLVRDDATGEIRGILARHAPAWGTQLAALDPTPTGARRRAGTGAPMPARMLREMADALEVLAEHRPLMLVLEDLHWSDPSTVDLVGYVARRRQPARLLVIGSLRPIETTREEHPLRGLHRDLEAKGLCEAVALELLSRDDVATYVGARFGGAPPDALRRLATRVHERTEGNALFMVNMVNDLVGRGLLAWRDGRWHVAGSIDDATDRIPSGVQELIDLGLRGLAAPERQVLEAASVAGDEFTVAAVAAALESDPSEVEDVCERLAAAGALLVDAGVAEWPDGSVSGRYRFRHALYRRVLYEGIAAMRRVRLHRAIGRREEAGLGARAGDHAAELAMHFTRGHAHARALHYHELAAAAALDRHAAHEAVAHQTAALEALAHAPESAARASRELALVVGRATLLMAIQGYAAPETERAFARAHALCDAMPAGPALYPVLRGLVSFHQVRAEFAEAHRVGEQLLRHAAAHPDDRLLRVQAHYAEGTTFFHEPGFGAARTHLEAALRDYDPATHREHIRIYGGYDPGVACSFWLSWTLALQGDVETAATYERDGLALAQRHGDEFSLAWAHYGVSSARQIVGDWPASEAAATEAARRAEEHGFPYVLGMATVNRGWALLMQGDATGIATLRDGVALVDRTGAALGRSVYLAMLGVTHLLEGDRKAAVARLDDALAEVERSGERMYEAGLLVGRSALGTDGERGRSSRAAATAIEDRLRRALHVAHTQGAHLLELRAAVALARHCRERGRADEGRTVLADAYAWFANRPPAAPEIAGAQQLLAELQP